MKGAIQMTVSIDLFEDEERQYINKIAEGRNKNGYGEGRLLGCLSFSSQ